jgi:GlpG protein
MSDPLMYIRLFTHVLGHSGFPHLIGNLTLILLLAPALEEKYGITSLLLVVLATALITGIFHNLIFPSTFLLGASGVVFAMIMMTSFTGFKEGEIPLTFILVALLYIGGQIWEGITVQDNISNLTHILGGLVGSGAGWILNRKKQQS